MLEIFKVAIKALIINDNQQVLLIYKSDKDDVNPNDYDIPGGRLQFGEKAEVGLQREIHEELGIQVEIGKPNRVRGYIKENTHLVGITFMEKYIRLENIIFSLYFYQELIRKRYLLIV